MNLKKHWGKHVLTLIILGVFAGLMYGAVTLLERFLLRAKFTKKNRHQQKRTDTN